MSRKIYRGKDVSVSFDEEVCVHSANCLRSLPAVFDLEQRPWVQPDRADAAGVRDAVSKCPSGALEIVADRAPNERASRPLEITVRPAGPLLLSGGVVIRSATGEVLFEGEKTALCRCGSSAKKPFCDGSHRSVSFDPPPPNRPASDRP